MNYILLYIFTLCVLLLVDFIWLVLSSSEIYYKKIGHLISDKPKLYAAGIFYVVYTFGILLIAVMPNLENKNFAGVLLYGALLGFMSYGTYDLTNLATLKGWPGILTIIDILWGTVLTTLTATAGYVIADKLNI